MKYSVSIAVTSRTFSKHPVLRDELSTYFSNIKFNDEGKALSGVELIEFLKDHDAAIIALEKLTEGVIKSLPMLKFVSKYGVGLDNIDLEALKSRNKLLGWKGGVNANGVAELALTFMLNLNRNVPRTSLAVEKGEWKYSGGRELSGQTVGIIGLGFVGTRLAQLLAPFQTQILVTDIVDKRESLSTLGGRQVPLDELLSRSDVISLHVPLDPSTKGLIGPNELAKMQPHSILINTSRGGVVDEMALTEALSTNRLRAAACDVFATEPIAADHPLLKFPQFMATPHVGGSSEESVLAMGRSAIEHIKEWARTYSDWSEDEEETSG